MTKALIAYLNFMHPSTVKTKSILENVKLIHFIGIGGIGMSALAQILHKQGFAVQGSEIAENYITTKLKDLGIKVFQDHNAANIVGADLIVKSTAIKDDNAEIVAALKTGAELISRADMLSEIVKSYHNIAVSGAHGKTTTTGIIGHLLSEAALSPTIINGGFMHEYHSNIVLGNSQIAVFEADESDGSFLKVPAAIKVVTNVDADHLDFHGSLERLHQAYKQFLSSSLPENGWNILCFDDPTLYALSHSLKLENVISYGLLRGYLDIFAHNIRLTSTGSVYDVIFSQKLIDSFNLNFSEIKEVELKIYGTHNIQNSLAAWAIGFAMEIPSDVTLKALATFTGVKRRFTPIAEVEGIKVIDDYAHHPEEIKATLKTAKNLAKLRQGRLIAVVQPHKYSRLKSLFQEFITCFDDADQLFITDVYSTGEQENIYNINSKMLVHEIINNTNKYPEYLDNHLKLPYILSVTAKASDVVIFLGAGNITTWAHDLPEALADLRKKIN